MSQAHCNLVYHIVFRTKDHEPWLNTDVRPRLHRYLGGAVKDEGGTALAVGGTIDHVHVLARLRQDRALADSLRAIKAHSSRWMHETFPHLAAFAWQAGYGAFSVSQSQVERVRTYVNSQEEHHRKKSFREEFVALLKANGMPCDERFLFDD